MDTRRRLRSAARDFGNHKDPMIGKRIGGINVFGGGLALYAPGGTLLGGSASAATPPAPITSSRGKCATTSRSTTCRRAWRPAASTPTRTTPRTAPTTSFSTWTRTTRVRRVRPSGLRRTVAGHARHDDVHRGAPAPDPSRSASRALSPAWSLRAPAVRGSPEGPVKSSACRSPPRCNRPRWRGPALY